MVSNALNSGIARTFRIGRPTTAAKLWLLCAVWFAFGSGLAFAAWGINRTPVLAILMPVLLFAASRRSEVLFYALGYHLTVVRFVPGYVATWFDSTPIGLLAWLVLGWCSAAAWTLMWTRSHTAARVALASAVGFILTLLPPIAIVLPGHPLVAWGYVIPGTAWFGVVFAVVATAGLSVLVRRYLFVDEQQRRLTMIVLGSSVLFLGGLGLRQPYDVGRVVGDFVAIQTGWGHPPRTDEDTIERIEKAAKITKELSKGPEPARLVVFPETAIGRYDPSFGPVVKLELNLQAKAGGQNIIVGLENYIRGTEGENLALLVRRDGTTAYAKQRQPALLAMWAPWRKKGHFPANWLANNFLTIEPGVKARVMFCYEEYIPFLHLLNEWQEPHNLVIAMANGWAAPTAEAGFIQARHTEGMARLFGHKFLRSENYQPSVADERRAIDMQARDSH